MLNLVRTRRSIRKFADRPVSEEHVQQLEEVVLRAPTSRNRQPWDFVFVTDSGVIRALSNSKPEGAGFLADAPLAVAVLADPERSDVWVEDASIAAAYLQLTAHSLGLGSCWIQIRRRRHDSGAPAADHVREVLAVPSHLEVLALFAIGHPAEAKEPVPGATLPREKLHQDRFDRGD